MLSVDLKNAFDGRSGADNFTVLLLRLIAKSDGDNRARLARGYPAEVKAVEIFQRWCPYADAALTVPDWDEIARRAEAGRGEGLLAVEYERSGSGKEYVEWLEGLLDELVPDCLKPWKKGF